MDTFPKDDVKDTLEGFLLDEKRLLYLEVTPSSFPRRLFRILLKVELSGQGTPTYVTTPGGALDWDPSRERFIV